MLIPKVLMSTLPCGSSASPIVSLYVKVSVTFFFSPLFKVSVCAKGAPPSV